MITRIPIIMQFIILICIVLASSFFVHIVLLDFNGFLRFDNLIIRSYLVNGLLASLIFIILFLLKEKLKNQIGFLFIAGSLLKFIVFFIFFYPIYRQDGVMEKVEFYAFFVPYLIALFIETFYIFKMLKKLD